MLGGGRYFSDQFIGDAILAIFMANIILNLLILLVPLFILARFDYETKIKSTWIWAVPVISIIGAYVDVLIFKENVLPWIAGLIIIGSSYFLAITLIMEHKFITGLIISLWAMLLNYIAWNVIDYYYIDNYGVILWALGVCYTVALSYIFIHDTRNYYQEEPASRKKVYIRNSICFLFTIILIVIPYIF